MKDYDVTIKNKCVTWSEEELKGKLQAIGNLAGRKAAWIRSSLSVSKSNWFTRLFWTVIAKHFSFLRTHLYGVDLAQSKLLLNQIKKQLTQDSSLNDVFEKAVQKFNAIAPKHAVAPAKKEVTKYVHLIGDSTLDNEYWLIKPGANDKDSVRSAKELSVKGQLKKQFASSDVKIVNHAVDGFTTKSLLEGDTIGKVLPSGSRKDSYMRTKANMGDADHFIKPLDELTTHIAKHPHAQHYVVLSVGGNDFRVLLGNPQSFLSEIPNIQRRYLEILRRIQRIQGIVQPILMTQYKTVVDPDKDVYGIYDVMELIGRQQNKSAMDMFDEVLQAFYTPILQRATVDKLPILNLSQTFDPHDSTLYTSGIEPSRAGGKLIAEGIHHVVTHHDMHEASATYAKRPGATTYCALDNFTQNVFGVVAESK